MQIQHRMHYFLLGKDDITVDIIHTDEINLGLLEISDLDALLSDENHCAVFAREQLK